MLPVITVAAKYWPAVVAGLYLAYVVAAGDTADFHKALMAFLGASGLSASLASAHNSGPAK